MRFFVTFEKSFDLVVDAESREALDAALGALPGRDVDDMAYWGGDTWDRHVHAPGTMPMGKAECVVVDGKLRNADDAEAKP